MIRIPHLLLSLLLSSHTNASLHTCLNLRSPFSGNTCRGPPEVFVVTESHGKGLGVFATHDIEVGDIIMHESPAIKIKPPKITKGNSYPMSEISWLVREQFEDLTSEAQDEIMSLTFHSTAAETHAQDHLGLIFRTNAYNTGTDIGLFPKIARINHSCRPNTSYYWDEKLNKRIVFASRQIKEGEEFFVSYISLLGTRDERQTRLKQYGFKCACEVCAQEGPAQEASDARRVKLRESFIDLESNLNLSPPHSKKGRKLALEQAEASLRLIEIVQEEGLADYYAKAYRIAAITHARIEDWQNAAIWSNRGYELRFIEDPQSQSTLEMRHLTSEFLEKWERQLKRSTHT
ncbi:hypothetical protein NX059_002789 [Plenodomus lindquistii]|nr:hypothetical protein NX059_002789 [Plenodomus lindquistii]